jgi:hypothetical protein
MAASDEVGDLNWSFDDLLINSDDEEPVPDDDDVPAAQSLVVPVQYDSDDDSEYEEEDPDKGEEEETWVEDATTHDRFAFTEECGIHADVQSCEVPIDYFQLFLTDELLNLIVAETNRYGTKKMRDKNKDWTDTTTEEMRQFIGICLYMGLVRLSKLRDYWSSDNYYCNPAVTKTMTRHRFELLLTSLHFADNDLVDRGNRLYKIMPVLDLLNSSFQKMCKPAKSLCIDESMVPFRGRIVFRQFNKSKRHKYGIKLFKLCSKAGYTQKVKVYAGRDVTRVGGVAEAVVLELMEGYLDQGRDLCTDNWYTSLPLANSLLDRRTNLVGTMRKNRKGIPPDVTTKKLKRGEMYSQQNNRGVLLLKWKDKRDILMLSTKHDGSSSTRNKPQVVEDYNKMKGFVDLSDQMAAYSPFVRRTTKWYIRLFFHLLTQTALVNAWILFNTRTRMQLNRLQTCNFQVVAGPGRQTRLEPRKKKETY